MGLNKFRTALLLVTLQFPQHQPSQRWQIAQGQPGTWNARSSDCGQATPWGWARAGVTAQPPSHPPWPPRSRPDSSPARPPGPSAGPRSCTQGWGWRLCSSMPAVRPQVLPGQQTPWPAPCQAARAGLLQAPARACCRLLTGVHAQPLCAVPPAGSSGFGRQGLRAHPWP